MKKNHQFFKRIIKFLKESCNLLIIALSTSNDKRSKIDFDELRFIFDAIILHPVQMSRAVVVYVD